MEFCKLMFLLFFILLLLPIGYGCPILFVETELDEQKLGISWDLEPEPFFYQIQIEITKNDTLYFRDVFENTSVDISRPEKGEYELAALLLYPACPSANFVIVSVEALKEYSYSGSNAYLLLYGFILFFVVMFSLCIALIITR